MKLLKFLAITTLAFSFIGCNGKSDIPNNLNELRKNLYDQHVAERTNRELGYLAINPQLQQAAQEHAEWMASTGNFSHTGKGRSNVATRAKKAGYTQNYKRIGENIAYGYNSVESVMRAWMNSTGHRNNILGQYNEIGIGVAVNRKGVKYWVAVFGHSGMTLEARFQDPPIKPILYTQYKKVSKIGSGWEDRGEEYIKWLAPSVRIGGGSGTICYYDPDTKYAYVISCGHLFGSNKLTYEQAKSRPTYKTIDVFYHNYKKLSQAKQYKAEVLFYENFRESVWDVSLMRFKADWDIEWYIPIAPKDIELEKGKMYHSLGCDGRSEVARYSVEYVYERQRGSVTEIITQKNSPRGGRSGGGVMTEEGELIAICSRGGGGYGYWTSLQQIHKLLNEEKEFAWLLSVPRVGWIRDIPIIDKLHPNKVFPRDYVPLP